AADRLLEARIEPRTQVVGRRDAAIGRRRLETVGVRERSQGEQRITQMQESKIHGSEFRVQSSGFSFWFSALVLFAFQPSALLSSPSSLLPYLPALLPFCLPALPPSVFVACDTGSRRERQRGARVRHVMPLEQLLDAGNVGTHQRAIRDHQRLATAAHVRREQPPFARHARL